MNLDWRRIVLWFGLFALVDAAVLVSPLSFPDAVLTQVVPQAIVPLLALVAAAYGLKVLASTGGTPTNREGPVETESNPDVDWIGGHIDEAFEALDADDNSKWDRENAARTVRSELRRVTMTALEAKGHSPAEAERLIDSGAWTDDRRAAAFLGDEHLPLRMRVRDWASGQGVRRHADAAVDELAAIATSPEPSSDVVPECVDRQPAGEFFGDDLGGERSKTEQRATLAQPEVDG